MNETNLNEFKNNLEGFNEWIMNVHCTVQMTTDQDPVLIPLGLYI